MNSKATLRRLKRESFPYLLIVPAILFIAAFLIYPVLNVFFYSLQSYDVARLSQRGFIGLDNFVKIFTNDKIFVKSLGISFRWVLTQVSAQLLLGMILALLLDKKFWGRGIYRCAVFCPWAISGVLTSMIWSLMYNQSIGVINDLLMKVGLIKSSVAWLSNTKYVFTSVVVAELWRGIPFFAIMLLASLQNIPTELYEACRVDGGKPWQELFYIKLPYLRETIILTTLLRAVWEFNNVDMILTLTGGGPSNMTTTLAMYMTNTSVKNNNYGYGSALAVVSFLILLVFAVLYLKLSKFGGED